MTKGLIIIDMIVRDVKKLRNSNTVIKNQLKLIDNFAKRKHKVILVSGSSAGKSNPVMRRLWGDEGMHDVKCNSVIPELMNAYHDVHIKKKAYSAFYKTSLESYCQKHKITELYFCGIYSGCCVYFSAADAAMRGIQPYLVSDASSSTRAKQHAQNRTNFETMLGPVMTTTQILKSI